MLCPEHKAVASDPILAPSVMLFITEGSSGDKRELLCLPWSHWHSFWLKFGNAETRQVQEDAQRVLARHIFDIVEDGIVMSMQSVYGYTNVLNV